MADSRTLAWLQLQERHWSTNSSTFKYIFVWQGLPKREIDVLLSHRGEKAALNLLKDEAKRCKKGEHVNVTRITQLLEEAKVTAKSRPHFTRMRKCDVKRFFVFLTDILSQIGDFGFELSECGEEMRRILLDARTRCKDERWNMNHVDGVLEDLDQRIGGRLIVASEDSVNNDDAVVSRWIGFHPEPLPFSVTLDLSMYIQPARVEERTKNQTSVDQPSELGTQNQAITAVNTTSKVVIETNPT